MKNTIFGTFEKCSSNIPNDILLDVNKSYVLSTLFCQLVILVRNDSFSFDYQKTPVR